MDDEDIYKCPFCGYELLFEEHSKYCPHVAFVFGWATEDAWIYADPRFATQYIESLTQNTALLDSEDYLIPSSEQMYAFSQGQFEPYDSVALSIPFFEQWAKTIPELPLTLVKWDMGYYSGVYVGFYQS